MDVMSQQATYQMRTLAISSRQKRPPLAFALVSLRLCTLNDS